MVGQALHLEAANFIEHELPDDPHVVFTRLAQRIPQLLRGTLCVHRG